MDYPLCFHPLTLCPGALYSFAPPAVGRKFLKRPAGTPASRRSCAQSHPAGQAPASGCGVPSGNTTAHNQGLVSEGHARKCLVPRTCEKGICPGGTRESSPALQRWVQSHNGSSPERTAEAPRSAVSLSRPFGTWLAGHRVPNAEALDYCPLSLRDKTLPAPLRRSGTASDGPAPQRGARPRRHGRSNHRTKMCLPIGPPGAGAGAQLPKANEGPAHGVPALASKAEARSPRAERRPSSEIRSPKPEAERGSAFGFRVSAFDLRRAAPLRLPWHELKL